MVINEIREIIKEELGISETVIKLSREFYNKMIEVIHSSDNIEKNETMIKKTVPMQFFIDDVKVSSNIVYRNFLSKDYSKLYEVSYVTDGTSFRVTDKLYFCFINVYAISGNIVKEKAMETIQHEIEHIFQQVKMGKGFENDSMYAKIKDDMESGNESRSKIGKMIYYTLKSEQEGFNNGLYAYLMDINQPYSDTLLNNSEVWQIYLFLKETFKEINNNLEMKNIFNEYFCNYGITLKSIEKEINNFLHRIGRTIIKVQQDKIKQGWRN